MSQSHSQQKIDRVDDMIRENNRKYIDKKSQLQYQRALQHYQKQRKRQALKQYASNIKQGNKKAIQKQQLKSSSISKNKIINNNNNSKKPNSQLKEKSLTTNIIQPQQRLQIQSPPQIVTKQKQKLSQKEIKKVQKAIQARAQRHLQQLQLQKINKKLQQQKKKTKLYELKQTCSRLLSKSHKRIPAVSQKVPESRRLLLQEYSKKAQEQVQQLDGIIAGLIDQSNKIKGKSNKQYREQHENRFIHHNSNDNKTSNNQLDVFSEEFEMNFMSEVLLSGGELTMLNSYNQQNVHDHNNSKKPLKDNNQDILFTKSAKQLFEMRYIPIAR